MKRIVMCIALLLVLTLALPLFASADNADQQSISGQAITATSGHVYLLLTGGEGRILYALPVDDTVLSQVDTATQIDEAIAVGDVLYYLRQSGACYEVVALNDLGEATVVATFEEGSIAYKLAYYNDALYCLVDGALNCISLTDSTITKISDRQMDEFVIYNGVVYYVSSEDVKEYNHASLLDSTGNSQILQSAGMLYAMLTDGSNDTLILAQGVDTLTVHDTFLYFHNLNDNYVMANSEEEWLEGLLYRLDMNSNDLTPVLTSYDWAFAPTKAGLMIYKSTGIELGTLSGEEFSNIYTPESYTTLGVSGTDLYVFEHTENTLTRIDMNTNTSEVLYNGGITYDPNATVEPEQEEPTEENTEESIGDVNADEEETVTEETPAGVDNEDAAKKTVFRKGDKGDEVSAFQKRLVDLGYLNKADGVFGEKTKSAVMTFQRKVGLYPDGVVGPATMSALYKTSAPTASTPTDSSYLLKYSDTRYLTEADVRKLDSSMWSFARNEILARHGYEFNTAAYAQYFGNKTWYKAGGFSWSDVSAIEQANIKLIQEMEKSIGGSDRSQYIFPDSNTRRLTEAEVRGISRAKLGYARNEILARHGYKFTTATYKNYFAGKSWYKAGGFSWSDLNAVEQANIELIKYVEANP